MLLCFESTAFYCVWAHEKASFIKNLDQDSVLEYSLAPPQECVPGKCSAILSSRRICWGAVTDQKQRFLHQSCASEQKAKTALMERNRQQSKHRFQCFIRKNYFKRLLWISLSLSFILQKMLLMSLLTCFQQCTIFACPVGNCEASKYRKSKDKDVSWGVHICVLHREISYITTYKIVDYCCVHETWWDTTAAIRSGPSTGAAGAFVILQSPVPASRALTREPSAI